MSVEKKFRFWMPVDDIIKAKDEEGNEIMKLGGIASTASRDTDGESLDPNQFDLSYLKSNGHINWGHSKDPDAIIGEPINAEIRKEGLWVESMLYPDSPLAKKVYKLAQRLQKNSKKRRLGYSIEGKATSRDPNDPTRVTSAMITNIALTPNPKNSDSIVDIIKGEFVEATDISKSTLTPEQEIDALLKSFNTSEKTKNIVDIKRQDGMQIIINEDYEVKIEKALSAGEVSGTETTNKTNVSGAPLKTESVDGNVKKLKENHDEEDEDADGDKEEFLTKAEVYEKIFEEYPGIGFEKAENIFNVLNNLTMKSNKTQITDDLLEKALTSLKKVDETTEDEIKKGEDEDVDDIKKEEDESSDSDEMEKGEDKKDEEAEDKEEEKEEFEKAEGDKDHEEKETKEEEAEEDDEDEEEMKKSLDDELIENKELENIQKSINKGFQSVGVVLKGMFDLIKAQQSEINSLKEIKKGETNDDLAQVIKDTIQKGFEEFGNEVPVGRKSIVKVSEKKFLQNDEIKKGIIEQEAPDTSNVLSVSKNKGQILQLFDKFTFEKGLDNEMANAMTLFEASSTIEPHIQKRFADRGIKLTN